MSLHDMLLLGECSWVRAGGSHMGRRMNLLFSPDTDLQALVGFDALCRVFEETPC